MLGRMARFKLRKPTVSNSFFGLSMGSTVTLMPVGSDYLLHGIFDPDIRWELPFVRL